MSPAPALDLERAAFQARRAARAPAAAIRRAARAGGLPVTAKQDGSALTAVDLEAERAIRRCLRAGAFPPGAAIVGEEEGEEEGSAPWRWIVDPIDGTLPFSRGLPGYGTLVALEERAGGAILAGAVHLPALGETFWAWRGGGAWLDGRALRVSGRKGLATAMVSTGTPYQYRRSGIWHLFPRLAAAAGDMRVYGDAFAHVAAARGALDAVFDPDLALWDFAATRAIVAEAGGKVLVRATGRGRGHDVLLGTPAVVDELAELLEFGA